MDACMGETIAASGELKMDVKYEGKGQVCGFSDVKIYLEQGYVLRKCQIFARNNGIKLDLTFSLVRNIASIMNIVYHDNHDKVIDIERIEPEKLEKLCDIKYIDNRIESITVTSEKLKKLVNEAEQKEIQARIEQYKKDIEFEKKRSQNERKEKENEREKRIQLQNEVSILKKKFEKLGGEEKYQELIQVEEEEKKQKQQEIINKYGTEEISFDSRDGDREKLDFEEMLFEGIDREIAKELDDSPINVEKITYYDGDSIIIISDGKKDYKL